MSGIDVRLSTDMMVKYLVSYLLLPLYEAVQFPGLPFIFQLIDTLLIPLSVPKVGKRVSIRMKAV